MSMSIEMSHFISFVRRMDYVRAAYWLGKVENEMTKDIASEFRQLILGAGYKKPDYDRINILLDSLILF